MKFSKIDIENFRQYYGNIPIDLATDDQKNIVVIGGRNGYGKTNLLLSIVWCLYGDKLSQIDDHFKKEIQKEKNYNSFMQQSINWTAKKEDTDKFSVTILIDETELPELKMLNSNSADSVIIKREFNVSTMVEDLHIIDPVSNMELFTDEEDKINFINNYIIPIDAAKFVFFDAEKIAEIANLSIREEGSFINDALGKILGLDTYETLIDDIETYINNLKKEGATKNLQEQIADKENAIKLSQIAIDKFEEENADSLKKIDELKKAIREFDNLISSESKQGNSKFDREKILTEISELKTKEAELAEKFNELSEILPLTILSGKLEEVNEHLDLQESNLVFGKIASENSAKIEEFIELLFNKPPEPENSSFSLKDKMFYFEKAQDLSHKLFNQQGNENEELAFEHDLSNADKKMIQDAIDLVNTQSKDFFETTIDEFNVTKIKLSELTNTLNKVDADLEDDIILEYNSKKEKADFQLSEANQQIGENKANISKEEMNVKRLNQSYQDLLKKVEINKKNKTKIAKSSEYLDVLRKFVFEQKEQKKESLAKNILEEMQKLMHKLNTSGSQFVTDIKVTILAEGNGMKITLYNSDDEEIKKEVLSQGEKQLYISSLIKAILKESIQSLPIFIDTPLGRLDDEHIKNILLYYYPDLSEQVVILSTNNEITPKRFNDISESVSKSYLLVNDGINTKLKKGYFHSYED
ncbi:AAA family ATPase [Gelidibacter mesophilus]|uniref:AAA family ATPase n=1 Tax=Gelidibacter mesophilus TaxID=169050 RepID=UPI00041A7D4D|nr:AAA family ATPase [Gelidibacter mesophilus]